MSRNYKFHNPEGVYFVSFAVIGWLDVFTRNEYKDILLESLSYCGKWLLEQFLKAGKQSSNVNKYQFWRHDNKPIEPWSNKVINEELSYIHNNPVDEGLVYYPEDYIYSSARDYSGEKGLLEGVIVAK